jgi:hypothetical protein
MSGVDMAVAVLAIVVLAGTLWYAAWEHWNERRWQEHERERQNRREE